MTTLLMRATVRAESFTAIFKHFAGALRARRAEAALLALDDRLLHDIGISRGEIMSAVHCGRSRRR